MFKTNTQLLELVSVILVPRLTDNRFNGQEQDKINVALTEVARCRCIILADHTFPTSQQQASHDSLLAQSAIIADMETNKQLQPWELYNAADLLGTLAETALGGVDGANVNL